MNINEVNTFIKNSQQTNIKYLSARQAIMLVKSMMLSTVEDYFLFFASVNLLNAYSKKEYAHSKFKNKYYYKTFINKALDSIIEENNKEITFCISKHLKMPLTIVNVLGLQFSFHSVKPSEKMKLAKQNNFPQYKQEEWSELRLQPIAQTLFSFAISQVALTGQTIAGITVKQLLKEVENQVKKEKID